MNHIRRPALVLFALCLLDGCELFQEMLVPSDPGQAFAVESVTFTKTLNRLTELRKAGRIDDDTQRQVAVWRESGFDAIKEAKRLDEAGNDFTPQLAALKAANDKLVEVKGETEKRKPHGPGISSTRPG
jgi:hypothetical protein